MTPDKREICRFYVVVNENDRFLHVDDTTMSWMRSVFDANKWSDEHMASYFSVKYGGNPRLILVQAWGSGGGGLAE